VTVAIEADIKADIEAELREEFDRGERIQIKILGFLPYVLLGISTAITLLQVFGTVSGHFLAVLALSAAAALWILWFQTLHPRRLDDRRWTGLYYAGLLVLIAGLVTLAPWYGFFAFIGYPLAFACLHGRPRYAGATATAMISTVSFMGGVANINADHLWPAWLAVGLLSAVLAGAIFWFTEQMEQRNRNQKRAMADLHEALAENASLHAQLLVKAREAGVLDERQRMARELHDTLAQGLAGIITQLRAALADTSTSRRHLTNALDLARESLTEARRTVHAVQPSVLTEARLPDAIGDVARRWAELHPVHAVLTTTGDPRPMHPDVEVALLRTAQEALANVAKHAQAARVVLTLSYMEDLVTLDVRDDGVGFDPAAKRGNGSGTGGFGLAGMRQRVQRLAGRLDIESEPGGGTAISAALPAIPAGGTA
jgi:signal transduction histidine kinase